MMLIKSIQRRQTQTWSDVIRVTHFLGLREAPHVNMRIPHEKWQCTMYIRSTYWHTARQQSMLVRDRGRFVNFCLGFVTIYKEDHPDLIWWVTDLLLLFVLYCTEVCTSLCTEGHQLHLMLTTMLDMFVETKRISVTDLLVLRMCTLCTYYLQK